MSSKNNPYDKHFKTLRGQSDKKRSMTVSQFEKELAQKKADKENEKKKKAKIPWKLGGFSILGVILTAYGYIHYDDIEKLISRIEVKGFSQAFSEEKAGSPSTAPETKTEAKDAGKEKAEAKTEAGAVASSDQGKQSDVLNHLTKLQDKKKELDQREVDLSKNEEELAKQRLELEKQLKALEDTRKKISTLLDDRIKADNEKIDSLVQMYTSMKPPQAAKVLESMDEDLAVEILARMKRKTAAEIMNIVKPEKAQILTEKFAGYKKK